MESFDKAEKADKAPRKFIPIVPLNDLTALDDSEEGAWGEADRKSFAEAKSPG